MKKQYSYEEIARKKFGDYSLGVWALNLSLWFGILLNVSNFFSVRMLSFLPLVGFGLFHLAKWYGLKIGGYFYCQRCRRIKPMRHYRTVELVDINVTITLCASCAEEYEKIPEEKSMWVERFFQGLSYSVYDDGDFIRSELIERFERESKWAPPQVLGLGGIVAE